MFLARLDMGSTAGVRSAGIHRPIVERRALLTEDGTRIVAEHLPATQPSGPAIEFGPPGRDLAVVVAHGFTLSSRHPAVRRIAHWLSQSLGVILLDMRGHGGSAGRSTVGWREILDVDAAVRWARVLGYAKVATLGFSLGSAVVLRQAGLLGGVDAVAAVSGPAQWYYRGTRPMRLLHHGVLTRTGRTIMRAARGTAISPHDWTPPYPASPAEAAAQISSPLLIVHGERDHYIPIEHGMRLHEVARPPKDLWILADFGHAESAVDRPLATRLATWLRSSTADTLTPARATPRIVESRGHEREAVWQR